MDRIDILIAAFRAIALLFAISAAAQACIGPAFEAEEDSPMPQVVIIVETGPAVYPSATITVTPPEEHEPHDAGRGR